MCSLKERTPSVLHVFSTFNVGGPQVRFSRIANATIGRLRHSVIATDAHYAAKALLSADAAVCFPPHNVPADKLPPARIASIRSIINQLNPELLVTYNWGAIEWAAANLFATVPHIHVEDGFGPEETKKTYLRRNVFRRTVLKAANAVIVPSLMLEEIASRDWKISSKQLRYIPNGIRCSQYADIAPEDAPEIAGVEQGRKIVGWIGALRPEKNVPRLLEAFSRVDEDAHLVVVGDGPEKPMLCGLMRDLDLSDRVHLVGHREHVGPWLSRFDVFALSSDTEQMPLVVLEAMAAGLPIAATDVGDIASLVAPSNKAFIVDPHAQDLSKAINLLLANSKLAESIGRENRARVESLYTEEQMIASYEAVFNEAIDH